jgi:hypothetical protein
MGVHSNKYITTTVDIIRTIITVDIMRIEYTDMVVGIIIETESARRPTNSRRMAATPAWRSGA